MGQMTVPTASAKPAAIHSANISQPINEYGEPEAVSTQVLAETGDETRQTQSATPAYDTSTYVLGKLCPRGHEYHGTGKTLLRLPKRHCLPCENEKRREKRQAPPA